MAQGEDNFSTAVVSPAELAPELKERVSERRPMPVYVAPDVAETYPHKPLPRNATTSGGTLTTNHSFKVTLVGTTGYSVRSGNCAGHNIATQSFSISGKTYVYLSVSMEWVEPVWRAVSVDLDHGSTLPESDSSTVIVPIALINYVSGRPQTPDQYVTSDIAVARSGTEEVYDEFAIPAA